MRRLNVRLLLIVTFAGVLFAVGVYFFHRHQVHRQADVYLERAREARANDRITEAVGLTQKYVSLRPTDADGLAEYGSLLADDEIRRYEGAFKVYSQVLLRDQQRIDVIREMVDLAIKLGRYTDALEHIQRLRSLDQPLDGELLAIQAVCHRALSEETAAMDAYRKAIDKRCEPEVYLEFATWLQFHHDKPVEALQIIQQVVEDHPDDYRSYVIRGNWFLHPRIAESITREAEPALNGAPSAVQLNQGKPDAISLLARAAEGEKNVESAHDRIESAIAGSAWNDALSAVRLNQNEPDVISLLARAAESEENVEIAYTHIVTAISENPESPSMYSAAAELEIQREDRAAAIAVLERGLGHVPDDPDLLWKLAGLHSEEGNFQKAKEASEALRRVGYHENLLAYLNARIQIGQQDWDEAVQTLEGIQRNASTSADFQKQLEYWTGICHRNLGHHDQAETAFRRAISTDPFWTSARNGLAASLLSQGDVSAALDEYWKLGNLPGAPLPAQLKWAELRILTNLQRDADDQDWQTVERLLGQIDQSHPGLTEALILRTEMEFLRGNSEAADRILNSAIESDPDDERLRIAQISLLTRFKNPDWARVDALLQEAKSRQGDTVAWRLAKANAVAVREMLEDTQKREELEKLARVPEEWSSKEAGALATGLARVHFQLGNDEAAKKHAQAVAKAEKGNLPIRLLLFDLAYRQRDASFLQEVVAEIDAIEGKGPFWQYGKAVQLVLRADEKNNPNDLAEAKRHLLTAESNRPSWSRVPWLLGEVLEREGDELAAIKKYQEAIQLGERRLEAITRAVNLLYRHNRPDEAYELLRRFEQKVPFSPQLSRLDAEISLQTNNTERALDLAKRAVEAENTAANQLYLGHVHDVNGSYAEAKAALHKAVELAPDEYQYRLALVQFLGRRGELADARGVIEEGRSTIAAERRELFNAQSTEYLAQLENANGHSEKARNLLEGAKRSYLSAAEQASGDPAVLRAVIDFFLRRDSFDEAEPWLRQLASADGSVKSEDQAWANRTLALNLSTRGPESFQEARRLIGRNLERDPESIDDKLARALVYSVQRTKQAQQTGLRLYEELRAEGKALPEQDILRLAQLNISVKDDWNRASRLLRDLIVRQSTNTPQVIAAYVQLLMQRDEYTEAEIWLRKLQNLAPDERMTQNLNLQFLYGSQQYEELEATLNRARQVAYAGGEDGSEKPDVASLNWNAAWLETFARSFQTKGDSEWAQKFSQDAETIYRDLAAKQGDKAYLLAGFLARRGEVDHALAKLEEAQRTDQLPDSQLLVISRLLLPQTSESQYQRLHAILDAAMKRQEEPAIGLMLLLADLHGWHNHIPAAERLYNGVLQQDPRNIQALNNLAMLIAVAQNRTDEAMDFINAAIKAVGEIGLLLDTRGAVHLASGNTQDALSDFDMALAEDESVDRHFHRSQALLLLGRIPEAQEAFKRAMEMGLLRDQLHPVERPAYDQLHKRFGNSPELETSL